MYRIEVKPGEESVFRTIEELATGIRNGFITPRARIYHAASQKWLPIEFHPHYKKALEGNFTPSAPAPQPSLAAMPAPTFAFPGATPAAHGPAPAPEPEPPAAPAPAPLVEPKLPPAVASTATESPVLAMRAAVHRPVRTEPEADLGPVERYSPVAVVEAPRTAPAPPPTPAPAHAPARSTAPEIVLPNITYPEVPPVEQTQHRAPARRSRRTAGRPLLLVGSAALLVFAGQRLLASRVSGSVEPAVAEAGAPEPAAAESPPAATKAPVAGRAEQTAVPAVPSPARPAPVAPAPVAQSPSRPMTPGPAFAASVPARLTPGASSTTLPAPAASVPPAAPRSVPNPDSAAIAPAPSAIELDVPAVLPGESIAPSLNDGRDSLAIKRILKAVTARKANPTAP